MLCELHSGCEADATYSVVIDPDSRVTQFGLTPPIHAICDSCWRPDMESNGWTDAPGGTALCCFCGAPTDNGKHVAYWTLNALCENRHSKQNSGTE